MKRLLLISSSAVLFAVVGAFAHSGATGIVKERMHAMKKIAAATKAIATTDWQDVAIARSIVRANATVLNKHASEIVGLFPNNSIQGPSEAIPAIWERPEEFRQLAKILEASSGKLIELSSTASAKDDIAPLFADISGTCKACHQVFRLKK